jgi:hypothetical protein
MAEILKDTTGVPPSEAAKAERQPRRTLTSDGFEPPSRPEGDGWMPLSQAAYWIATAGGILTIDLENKSTWQNAYGEILDSIKIEKVEIRGRQNGLGEIVQIGSESFCDISAEFNVDYPFVDTPDEMVFGRKPHIRCHLVVDEKHRDCGFNDQLILGHGEPKFTNLHVKKSDIARLRPKLLQAATSTAGQGLMADDAKRALAIDYWPLPEDPPRQKSAADAHKALLHAYPGGQIPRLSAQRLADMMSNVSKSIGGPPTVSREAVLRALNLKP